MENFSWLLNISAIGIGLLACIIGCSKVSAERVGNLMSAGNNSQVEPVKLIELRLAYAYNKIASISKGFFA
jgi:hypothetical protein